MRKTITLYTFLTKNSADYAELLRKSCEKLKSCSVKIKYKCVESVGCERAPDGWEKALDATDDLGHNCKNHADAMNQAYRLVGEDDGIILFVDADMCVLYKDWDLVLCNVLDVVDIFGTAFGDDSLQYHNFPNVFFFAFNSRIKKRLPELCFDPIISNNGESPARLCLSDEKIANVYGKSKGDILKCDTGCSLPEQCRDIDRLSMPRVLGRDANSQLPYKDLKQKLFCNSKPLHMAEWHYNCKLFVTHKQASRNHPLDGKWGKVWKDRIDLYTKKEYGWML
jgi:hypothetical protein